MALRYFKKVILAALALSVAYSATAFAKPSVNFDANKVFRFERSFGGGSVSGDHTTSRGSGNQLTLRKSIYKGQSHTIAFKVRRGEVLRFTVSPSRSSDLDLYLWNGFRLKASDKRGSYSATIHFRARETGTYYLVVHHYGGPFTRYTISGSIS